jgi:basic membrane protein A and related proteins
VRTTHKTLAILAVAAIAATACGSKSNGGTGAATTPSASASSSAAASAFKACMVTDTGGIDDRSFNASAWQGITNSERDLGVQGKYLQSTSQNDYTPNINALLGQSCGIIVTVGFLMGDATKTAATANPNQKFAIVDNSYTPTISNVDALLFDTSQAGFLGGYLAAGMSKAHKIATFGGIKIGPVTIYMDGFAEGAAYYDTKHGTKTTVLGWNVAKQNGTFTGDFTDQAKGKNVTESFMQQGADIIFPVAGNVGLGAAAAVKQSGGGKVHMLWVDTDGCISAPQYCSLFVSSVLKGIATAVETAVKSAQTGSFKGGNYVGTLANGGVGLAPYHDFASQVPSALQSEIAQVKAGIIAGTIKVTSPSAPQAG